MSSNSHKVIIKGIRLLRGLSHEHRISSKVTKICLSLLVVLVLLTGFQSFQFGRKHVGLGISESILPPIPDITTRAKSVNKIFDGRRSFRMHARAFQSTGEKNAAQVSVVFSSLYGIRENADMKKVVQERWAVKSWANFGSRLHSTQPPKIIGLVDDDKYCDAWLEENVPNFLCVALQCPDNKFGIKIPTIPCIFREAAKYARPGTLVAYVNGDILFPNSMAEAISAITSVFGISVQVVGERLDIAPPDWLPIIGFNHSVPLINHLEDYANKNGELHGDGGMDYFFFPEHYLLDSFPEFFVGRWRWDNAMMLKLLLRDLPTIDVTKASTVIHFGSNENINDDYSHHIQREGSEVNNMLAWQEFGPLMYLGRISNVPLMIHWDSNDAVIIKRDPRNKVLLRALWNDDELYHALNYFVQLHIYKICDLKHFSFT